MRIITRAISLCLIAILVLSIALPIYAQASSTVSREEYLKYMRTLNDKTTIDALISYWITFHGESEAWESIKPMMGRDAATWPLINVRQLIRIAITYLIDNNTELSAQQMLEYEPRLHLEQNGTEYYFFFQVKTAQSDIEFVLNARTGAFDHERSTTLINIYD